MTKARKPLLNRVLSLVLIVLLLVSIIPIAEVSVSAAKTDILFGDVNGDGTIDFINDVVMVNNYINGNISFSEEQKILADVNGDNSIDNTDVQLLNTVRQSGDYYSLPIYSQITEAGFCGENGNNVKYVYKTNGSLIIFGEGAMDDHFYMIPDTWMNNIKSIDIKKGITSIKSYTFYDLYSACNVTSITLPDSVTSIGTGAFNGLSNLRSIVVNSNNPIFDSRNNCNAIIETSTNKLVQGCDTTVIPNDISSIGWSAFCRCKGLTAITIPDSVTVIGYAAFRECSNLKNISISKNVVGIGAQAFLGCTSLSTVTIPNSLITLGDESFRNCQNLSSITLSNQTNKILQNTFYGCRSLSSITIPDSVTSIGFSAFEECTNLKRVTLSKNLSSLDDRVFSNCNLLSDISLPDSLTSMGRSVFSQCKSLSSITIPNGVTKINDYTFGWCDGLKNITIPESVISISENAFYNSSNLTINGYPGSYAQTFANNNGISFLTINTDNIKPTVSLSSTNNVAASQTVTVSLSDNVGVSGFYWGKNTDYSKNDYTGSASTSYTIILGTEGTYYATAVDTSGNVSSNVSITFYKTTLNANGGSVSPISVLTKSGNSFTFPTPTRNGYTYNGWSTSPDSIVDGYYIVGAKSLKPSSDTTYYALWEPNAVSINDCTITLGTSSYTYDGSAKSPSVTVKYGSTTLIKDTDYTVTYSNNTNAGTATVTITGKGGYTGSTNKNFTINAKSISSATVTLSQSSYTYDGTEKKPTVTVKDGTKTLTLNTDYTVSYSNNINAGTATVTVSGKGNYNSSTSKNFTIVEPAKINISNCTITLGTTSYTYDGSAKQPSVTVKYGSTTLIKDTDYTVTYSNNTNAGTATVTITGKGGYTGSTTKNFSINAKSISSATVTLSQSSYTYDGTEKKPTVTVKDGTKTLTSGTDYTVSYSNNINAGTATVTVSGKGNYNSSTSKNFTIVEPAKINISNCTITLGTTSYTYDGSAKQPSVTVKYGSTTLIKDTDYTVTYSNNTNAGTATVTITGKGGYTGSTTKNFSINAKSISSATVTLSQTSYTYDGTEKKPTVTVKDGSKTLTSGTDYTVAYSNNINAGTATVTVSGKGNYSGSKNADFTISPGTILYPMAQCTIRLAQEPFYIYSGAPCEPAIVVTHNGNQLVKDRDYYIEYSNNINAGTATVLVHGKNNPYNGVGYRGDASITFPISPRNLTDGMVTLSQTSYTYDGTEKRPSVIVKDGSSTLTSGTDYTVSYSNNINVGTATVTVTGKGNYSSSSTVTKSFTISNSYETISLNSTKTVTIITEGEIKYYSYKPSSDVTVSFYSTGGDEDTDTYGYIYDENLNLIDNNDDDGENRHFKIAYPLKAGTTYIFACKFYDDEKTGSFEIYLEAYTTETFVWGQDNWNFNNSSRYFGKYYYVDESIISTLKNQFNIDNTDISNMNRKMNDKNASKGFTGSCYGMTVSEMLVKQGFLNLADYGGYSTVNRNSNSNRKIISLINAIQLLQNTGDFSQTLRQTQFSRSSFTQYEFIGRIEDVLQNNRMFLKIGYSINGRVKGTSNYFYDGSHAVLAYGIESCSYYSNVTYKTYDRKILICDPNRSINNKISDDACIYYRSSDHSWIIPYWYGDYYNNNYGNCTDMCYWNAGSTLDTKTGSIDNVIRYDAINESVDLMSEYGTDHYIAGLELNSNNEAFVQEIENSGNPNMEFAGEGGSGIVKFGTESDIDENGDEAFDSYALWNPTANYAVSFSSPSRVNSLMDYEKVSYYLDSTNSTYVLYKPSGYIKMNGSEADYDITMVTDDSECVTDWYEITVSGSDTDSVTLKKSNGGYILTANNLSNITISTKNDTVSANRELSTDYDSVFIYEIDETHIGLKVDTDNNGTYETELPVGNPEIPDELLLGDVDGDGEVTIIDATCIQRHLASIPTFAYIESAADTDGDGEVTIIDATYIQRWLANLQSNDKIGKPLK